MSEYRRRNRIDGDHLDRALFDSGQHRFHSRRVGGLFEAFANRFVQNKMIRQLDRRRTIFTAGLLPGKNRRQQFIRTQSLQIWRNSIALVRAHDGEGARRHMAKAQLEHRRVQKRLRQHVARIARGHHVQYVFERKAVACVERDQTRIVDRGSLDFEVEALAKALTNRETEASIEADSERRVDYDLGAAEPIEEALDDDSIFAGNGSQSCCAAPHEIDGLARRVLLEQTFGLEKRDGARVALAIDAICDFATQLALLFIERRGTARRLGLPEWN